MRLILSALFLLSIPVQLFAADIATFCKNTPEANFGDVIFVINNKDKIQTDLHQRENQAEIESLLVSYNTLNAKLGGASSKDFEPIMAIAGFCYMKITPSLAEGYKDIACPKIRPKKTSDIVNLALTAKAIVTLSSGPETPEIKRLKDSKLDASFITEIDEIFSICGAKLGSDDEEEEPIEEEEEELPGVCTASPYSKLSEFLWKPVSEKNGRLVVLTNPTTSLVVNGETLSDSGASNGRCTTSRGNSSGCGYGRDILVAVTTLSEFRIIQVPDGCKRYECKSSLSACGLESWDSQELLQLKKQRNKLKNKILNTTQAKKKRNLRKKVQDINKILNYAKSFGA